MYTPKLTINERIEFATTAIMNATNNAPIREALDAFGYDAETLKQGETLLESLKTLHAQQQQEYNEQRYAISARDALRDEINEQYIKHIKLARVAFKNNPDHLIALGLVGSRLQSYPGWKGQVTTFYNSATKNSEITTGLARFKITEVHFNAMQTKLTELGNAEGKHQTEASEAEKATLDRNKALEALDNWMSDFQEVAKIALEDDPQRLEALGIVAK